MPKPPANSAEQFVLGSVLLNPDLWVQVSGMLTHDSFAEERHRRVFLRMKDIADRGERIDRVTLSNELMRSGQLESVGGFSYIVSLDEGLPALANVDSWVRIVRDARDLRSLHLVAQYLDQQAQSKVAPLDLISDVQNRLQEIERGSLVLDSVPRMDEIVDSLGGVLEIINPTTANASIQTHFKHFDTLTSGLEAGTLTVIAGRVSSGKTSLAMCMAHNIAENETPVAMFSLEMSKKALIDRMICVKGEIDFTRYRARRLTPLEQDDAARAIEYIYDLPIYIDDKPVHSMENVARKIDRLVTKHGVRVVMLDYCQMLTNALRQKGDRRNTTEILGAAVEAFKGIAKRLNIAVVLLSQLSRDPDKRSGDHRPMITDLKDSSSLEQAADLIVMAYREWSFKQDQLHLKDHCELIVGKARNGATGVCHMRFEGQYGGKFSEI